MNDVLIITNGDLSQPSQIKKFLTDKTTIIAVDGGANIAHKLDIIPDFIIGDMDSISSSTKNKFSSTKTRFIQFPPEKDSTDTELAIQFAIDQGYKIIIITGLLGTRIDHMFANFFYFKNLLDKHIELIMIEGHQEFYLVKKKISIQGKKDDLLSLIPFGEECNGITTYGLQYSLQSERLPVGSTRGISNVFVKQQIQVTITQGTLLAVHTSCPTEEIEN